MTNRKLKLLKSIYHSSHNKLVNYILEEKESNREHINMHDEVVLLHFLPIHLQHYKPEIKRFLNDRSMIPEFTDREILDTGEYLGRFYEDDTSIIVRSLEHDKFNIISTRVY